MQEQADTTAEIDQERIYKALAKKYSRMLPRGSPLDWEDLYQEMCIREIEYHSIKSVHWKAQHIVRDEWVRRQPRELTWIQRRSPRLDTICEAYRLIKRWPWLLALMIEGNQAALARVAGVQKAAIGKRLNHVRADLGLVKRYRLLVRERGQPEPPLNTRDEPDGKTQDARAVPTVEEYLDQYQPIIQRIARKMMRSGLPSDLFYDLCQAGTFALLEVISRVDLSQNPDAFIKIRIKGAITDEYRRYFQINRARQSIDYRALDEYDTIQTIRDQRHDIDMLEAMIDIEQIADSLNEKQRYVIIAYFIQDKTYQQIASELGCNESMVAHHMRQIREILSTTYMEVV